MASWHSAWLFPDPIGPENPLNRAPDSWKRFCDGSGSYSISRSRVPPRSPGCPSARPPRVPAVAAPAGYSPPGSLLRLLPPASFPHSSAASRQSRPESLFFCFRSVCSRPKSIRALQARVRRGALSRDSERTCFCCGAGLQTRGGLLVRQVGRLLRTQHNAVPVGILEDRCASPVELLRFHHEFHTLAF